MTKPTSFSEFQGPIASRPMLVDQLIPQGVLSLFTGNRNSGKTIISLLLLQGIVTKYAFLGQRCAGFKSAFFSRYEKKEELASLARRIAPKLTFVENDRAPIYGCFEPDNTIPEIGDDFLNSLVSEGHYLIFDGIPDPRNTTGEDPELFLRTAQRLARNGPGVAMFGSTEWEEVPSIKNRVDLHFPISKEGDRLTVSVKKSGRKAHLTIPDRDTYPFQIDLRVE
jgi:hypothetical protein